MYHDFQGRVDLACRYISDGRRTNRTFDGFFEMHDGDAMVVAVYRRAMKNPRIKRNIWRYLARVSVVPIIWRERRRTRAEIKAWADEMRREADAKYAHLRAAS